MAITVQYFAGAKAAAGCAKEEVDSVEAATVGQLRTLLTTRHGDALARVLEISTWLVDGKNHSRADGELLPDGTVVEILPPFAGG